MTIVNGTVLFIVNWRFVAQIQPWFSLWASLSPTTVFWCHWTTFSTRRWRVVVERWILLALAHAVGLLEDCRVFCPGKLLVVWLVFSLSGTARVIAGSSSWGCYCIWSKSVEKGNHKSFESTSFFLAVHLNGRISSVGNGCGSGFLTELDELWSLGACSCKDSYKENWFFFSWGSFI